MLKVGHVVVLLVRNAAGRSCSSFVVKIRNVDEMVGHVVDFCKEMLKVGHVVLLLLRNIKFGHVVVLLFRISGGCFCNSFVVKKCWRLVM